MNPDWLRQQIERLQLDNNIELNDIPEIDLYMDQLITLFENKLAHTKRSEEDKLLTKTMINNYTKDKVIMAANKKKYTKEHIILMILLYQLKHILSINDIKSIFDVLKEDDEVDSIKLKSLYLSYLECKDTEVECFKVDVERRTDEIKETLNAKGIEDEDMETILLVIELIEQAVYHKKLAERIIDEKLIKKSDS